MADAALRDLERRAAGGDEQAATRLGLEACRRGDHAPPHFGDDEWASVTRIATPFGTRRFCEWTCPRCWEQASATEPAWLDATDDREAQRIAAARRAMDHERECPTCRGNLERETAALAAAYPRVAPFKRVPCSEDAPGGINAWRFDGTKEAARRRAAGEAL